MHPAHVAALNFFAEGGTVLRPLNRRTRARAALIFGGVSIIVAATRHL
jgi:hypothetical protein